MKQWLVNVFDMVFWFTVFTCAVFSMIRAVEVTDETRRNVISIPNFSSDRLLLVSTLDGLITALYVRKDLKQAWQIDLGSDLFASTLRSFEVMRGGKLSMIVPSLQGGLFALHNSHIETLPFSSDTLLSSGFRLTDQVFIVGSIEIKTYTVNVTNGVIIHHSSKNGSVSSPEVSNSSIQAPDAVIFRITTRTVRAVSVTGAEKWHYVVSNVEAFSIAPSVDTNCFNNTKVVREDLSFSIPDGIVYIVDEHKRTYNVKLGSPISKVWEYDDGKLREVNLFDAHHLYMDSNKLHTDNKRVSPIIYMGEYRDQYYVQVSDEKLEELLEASQKNFVNQKRLPPAKDIRSNSSNKLSLNNQLIFFAKHDQLSISRFTESEVNALSLPGLCSKGGFFLLDDDTTRISSHARRKSPFSFSMFSTTYCALFTMFFFFRNDRRLLRAISNRLPQLPMSSALATIEPPIDYKNMKVVSRYADEYTHVRCLGKGGFGVVFEAKNFLDCRCLAIKRIKLNNDVNDKVVAEIRYLAQIQHQHVVQYYGSWLEIVPRGWQKERDKILLGDFASSDDEEESEESTSESQESSPSGRILPIDNNSFSIIFDVSSPLPNARESNTLQNVGDHANNSDVSVNIEFRDESQPNNVNGSMYASSSTEDSSESTSNENASNLSSSEHIAVDSNFLQNVSRSEYSVEDVSQNNDSDRNNVSVNRSVSQAFDGDPRCEYEKYLYFSMELCQQQTLKEWLMENTTNRSFDDALWFFFQICQGLDYIHEKKFIHRDLKPSNIFFSVDSGLVKIGDFGLVTELRDANNSVRRTSRSAVGTELYMSPEQIALEPYDEKVDIYALGIILFELVHPFDTQMERIVTLKCLPKFVNSQIEHPSREITALTEFKEKNGSEFSLISLLLSLEPKNRPSCKELLVSPLFRNILLKYVNAGRLQQMGLRSSF